MRTSGVVCLVLVTAGIWAQVRAFEQAALERPCAECVVAAVTIDEMRGMASAADELNGAQVVLEVPTWAEAPHPALTALAGRGLRITLESRDLDHTPPPDVLRPLTGVLFDLRMRSPDAADALALHIKQRSVELRSISVDLRIGIEADSPLADALRGRGVEPYVDFVVSEARSPWIREGPQSGLRALAAPHDGHAERVIRALPARYVSALARLSRVAPAMLTASDAMTVRCVPECRSQTLLNPETLDSLISIEAHAPPERLLVEPPLPPDARAITISDAGDVVDLPFDAFRRTARSASFIVVVPAQSDRFATGVRVRAARHLSVEEIVARHQAERERQRRAIHSVISRGRTLVMFDAPGFGAPITIGAETTMYARADLVEVEQRDVRVNGLAWGNGVPRLPLIQAERIATPPMSLTLDEAYRYELERDESAGGRLCYRVAFSSKGDADVRGRAWIAADDFALVRLQVTQRSSNGPIVWSDQRDEFQPQVEAGLRVWLPVRTEIHQMYEGAAHRTPIHRIVEITTHIVNAPDFDDRLLAAHRRPSVMLRDTPEGFRYLDRRDGSAEGDTREVRSSGSSRVRTAALGVIIDPNITRPLPFAGVNYLDFNLFGRGIQLNAFGGVGYGRASVATGGLGGTRWQAIGDAFAIAATYNDRVFIDGREQYDLNLRQRPAHAMVGIMRPLTRTTRSMRVRGEYHVDYTRLERGDTTDAGFVLPASPIVHAARIAIQGQRGPWSADVWWSPAVRQRWTPWGLATSGVDEEGSQQNRAFQRVGASLTRSFIFSERAAARVDVAWMGGRDLDRFSRFTFGTFENHLHGYPAATIRFDRGAIAHSVATYTAASRLRIDGFFDVAAVRDAAFAFTTRTYPGLGAGVEVPMPHGVLLAAEWGYGVRGVSSSGQNGTHVVRVSAYKMF
jgi:hypothetical protein